MLASLAGIVVVAVIMLPALAPCPSGRMATFDCYRSDIENFLSLWAFGVSMLGPIPVFVHQFRAVRSGARSGIAGCLYSILGAVVATAAAFAILALFSVADAKFHLFDLFAGKSALGAVFLLLWLVVAGCVWILAAMPVSWWAWQLRNSDLSR